MCTKAGFTYGCSVKGCSAEADPDDGVWTVKKTKRGEVWTKSHYCRAHKPEETP